MVRSMYAYMKFSKNKFKIDLTLNICVCIHADRQTGIFSSFLCPLVPPLPSAPRMMITDVHNHSWLSFTILI